MAIKNLVAVGIVLASSVALAGCSGSSSTGGKASAGADPAATTPVAAAASTSGLADGSTSPATPSSSASDSIPMPPKLVLPKEIIDPAKLPPADPAIVAAIKAGPNGHFLVNYMATIDQAARTHDTAALDQLIGCAQGHADQQDQCAKDDKLWATPGVVDQIPLLLEKATVGQDSGNIYVPAFTGPEMFAESQDTAEKKLLGVAFPSEYRGLVLGFQARSMVGSEMSMSWQSAGVQQAPASTTRLANLTTVTSANMPAADPEILAKVQSTMDSGKPLVLPANLVALVVEAAQDHDIDALVKLCGQCSVDPAYKTKFVTAITQTVIPYNNGRFDELARILMTHPALANSAVAGMYYPGYDQTWLKPWSATNPDGPKPEIDAADKTKYCFCQMPAGYVEIKTEFQLGDGGQSASAAWVGLDGLS